ncbi:MAG: hypothetical protein NVS1B13_07540 [Flavisolibacter sp.]
MIKKWFFLLLILVCENVSAQTTLDTIVQPDTPKLALVVKHRIIKKKLSILKTDSVLRKRKIDSTLLSKNADQEGIRGFRTLLLPSQRPEGWLEEGFKYGHPYFTFTNPVHLTQSSRKIFGKEDIFYALVSLLIFFALIKNGFYRYVLDLFRIFFRTTVRQRQIKEQLIQSPLPALLLNIFFIITGGLFIDVLLRNFKMGLQYDFWILFLYGALALIIIYAIKYLTLKFFGWVFQVSDSVETYIFIVFSTNKVAGIFLLPFVVILSFSYGLLHDIAITLSITLVVILFVYRYFLSYVALQRQLKISFFHFALYFCAFELAPVLLINKLLFRFLI